MNANRSKVIQVMLLDDHPVVRDGFALHLNTEPGISIVGSYSESRELMAALTKIAAHVVVMDYSLGPEDVDGVNLIRALRLRAPNTKVLVASGHSNTATVSLALRAGAHGFVGKGDPVTHLAAAIRAVAAGHRYVSRAMEYALDIELKDSAPAPEPHDSSLLVAHAKLTPREGEVLRCFLDGLSVSQIAAKFSRDINTISTQKQSAFRKLGIRSDNELFKLREQLGRG